MDGNIYNYASGNMWNGYNEGFQAPPLDLQTYIPTNRDHFPREQCKNHLVPPAPPYVFFNYSEDTSHHHHHIPENINRNQWHFPAWPKMKVRPDAVFHEGQKRYVDKQFHKDCGMLMPSVHQGPSNLNIPPPVGYYSPDTSDQVMIDIHRVAPSLESQKPVNTSIPEITSFINNHSVLEPNCIRRSNSRKNPAPRRRKDTSKKDDKLTKKRIRDEEKWARNIRKKARSKGESYVSVQGKTVPARSVKTVDCSKCKFNCPSRVLQEEREKLFKEYWDLQTFKEKVDYISGCIHEFAPLRPVSGRRAYSRRYTLKVNGQDERVCKEFFVSTFDISESTIVTYMAKKRKGPEAVADLRGKQTPSNKTPESTVRLIREHILSQIGLQGELSRSPSEDIKNVKRLYQHYQMECEMETKKPASISVYRKVYSDMHKDKNNTPVEIPPDNVFLQSKKTKRLKCTEKENGVTATSSREMEDEESAPFEYTLSPELSTSSNSLPAVAEITSTIDSTPLPVTSSTHHELGLRHYSYQGNGQCLSSNALSDKKTCNLNIPHSLTLQQHPHSNHQHIRQQVPFHPKNDEKPLYLTPHQGEAVSSSHEQGHVPNMMPFLWDSGRMGGSSVVSDHTMSFCPASYSNQGNNIQPPSSALTSSLFTYRLSSSPLPTSSISEPQPFTSTSTTASNIKHYQTHSGEALKRTKEGGSSNKIRKSKEKKSRKEVKKRTRNEESWGRNVRKRLRFKGEAYTSVRGKLVEAKSVKDVDCSDCKFKCTSRINNKQREKLNKFYWSLDTYKNKIEFLTKHVATYTPKRKMTGRRAFSRKYSFDIDGSDERVCKDFFKATLHISESTIATALEKSRMGPDAIVDMRGKHKPINKTTEETLQNIRELIIYITGMRPHRTQNNQINREYRDINRLYQVYKYDSEKKGKKVASLGIFRNVVLKEFCIKSLKPKKGETSQNLLENHGNLSAAERTTLSSSSSSSETWPISIPQPCSIKSKISSLNEHFPKSITYGDSHFGDDLNIPNL